MITLGLFLFSLSVLSQSLIDSGVQIFQNATLKYYFNEDYFSGIDGKHSIATGTVSYNNDKRNSFYKVKYTSFNRTYETIKNSKHFGCNIYDDNYFEDFSKIENHSTQNYNGINYFHVFVNDSTLKTILNDKNFIHKETSTSLHDIIILENNIEKAIKSNIGQITQKSVVIKYYLSKVNHTLLKSTSKTCLDIGGFSYCDSVIYLYRYTPESKSTIKKSIRSFKPLSEKKTLKSSSDSNAFKTLKAFPMFNLPDTSGKIYNSSSFKAKYVLIEFWYKSCAPCLQNMNNLEKIRRSYDYNQLEVVAINPLDKMSSDLIQKVKKYNKTYLFLFDSEIPKQTLKLNAYPTTIIYDNSTKKIIFNEAGVGSDYFERIDGLLRNILSKQKQ